MGLPTLEVSYEQLTTDYAATCGRLQGFLGVPAVTLTPAVYKLQNRPLREVVDNYAQVVEALADVPLCHVPEASAG